MATLAAGLAGGLTGDSTADTVAGAQTGKNAVENNHLLQMLMPPPPVAGQTPQSEANAAIAQKLDAVVNEFGKDVVTKCLSGGDCPMAAQIAILAIKAMMGEGENGPSNTGGDQIAESGPTNTGGNQTLDPSGKPTHTGNNQSSDQGATNTGNTEGKPDTGGNTTVTPIPGGLSQDDIA
nr:VENN motif pre-toxin domain-containing protein [Yersinia rohdei]